MAYSEMATRTAGYTVLYTDWNAIVDNFNALSVGFVPGGRLCGVTADPAGDSPSTATLYYTPYLHNGVKLYDGANWVYYNFSEISLSLTGLTNAYNHDVFLYNNAGTLTLETTQWTNATTRATAITRQDGVYVRSGSTGRLYLGTIRASATGQTIDTNAYRFIWNMYNRMAKEMYVADTADSWTYNSGTWRSFNNSIANTLLMVRGLDDDVLDITFSALTSTANGCIGLQVGSPGADGQIAYSNTGYDWLTVRYCDKPGLGYRALYLSERVNTGTATFYGDVGGGAQSAARGYAVC